MSQAVKSNLSPYADGAIYTHLVNINILMKLKNN